MPRSSGLINSGAGKIDQDVLRAKLLSNAGVLIEGAGPSTPALRSLEEAYSLMVGQTIGPRYVGKAKAGSVKNFLEHLVALLGSGAQSAGLG